jgi:hypothetical protein
VHKVPSPDLADASQAAVSQARAAQILGVGGLIVRVSVSMPGAPD